MYAKVWDSVCWTFLSVLMVSLSLRPQFPVSQPVRRYIPRKSLDGLLSPRFFSGASKPQIQIFVFICSLPLRLWCQAKCLQESELNLCIKLMNTFKPNNGDRKGRRKVASFVLVVKVRVVGWRALAAHLGQLSICELVLSVLEKVIYPQRKPGQSGASPGSWGPLYLVLHVRLISMAN